MTTAQALREAKARIDSPEKWARHELKTADGRLCAVGAIEAQGLGHAHPARTLLYDVAAEFAPEYDGSVVLVNDRGGHSEVMQLFDRAIAKAEGK